MQKPILFIEFIFLFFIFALLINLMHCEPVKLFAKSAKEKLLKIDKKMPAEAGFKQIIKVNKNLNNEIIEKIEKAIFPSPLWDIFFTKELQNFIYYRELISKAQTDLALIRSIRGEVEFIENRNGIIAQKQNVSFLLSREYGFYLQWRHGENYQRRFLFQKKTNELFIQEGSGLWQKLGEHSLARNALHLDRGGQFFLTFHPDQNKQFWFSHWLEELSTIVDWIHADETYMLKEETIELIRGEKAIRLDISAHEKWPEDLPKIIMNNFFTGRRSIIWLRQKDLFPIKMIQYQEASDDLYFSIEFFDLSLDEAIDPQDFSFDRKSQFSD